MVITKLVKNLSRKFKSRNKDLNPISLEISKTALLLIDIQEKLIKVIPDNEKLLFNIKKLINISTKWPGLNGLDLAKEVTTKKTYTWKGLKTWEKGKGFKKNKKKSLRIIAIDYGIKKKYFKIFF